MAGCAWWTGDGCVRLLRDDEALEASTRVVHDLATDATLFVYLNRNDLSLNAPMLDFVHG